MINYEGDGTEAAAAPSPSSSTNERLVTEVELQLSEMEEKVRNLRRMVQTAAAASVPSPS